LCPQILLSFLLYCSHFPPEYNSKCIIFRCEIFVKRRRRPPNIGLTFKSVPEGLVMVLALSSRKNHDKGFIRLKRLLDVFTYYINNRVIIIFIFTIFITKRIILFIKHFNNIFSCLISITKMLLA